VNRHILSNRQLTLEIDTNSKVIDQALKKIELESQEQNQKLLVESINVILVCLLIQDSISIKKQFLIV